MELDLQNRVNEICNGLYAQGDKISVRIILSLMDDVSSTSTIHRYYSNWRKELDASQQSLYDKLGFSSEFTQMFMKEVSRFGVEAEARYKGIATEADSQRQEAIADLAKIEGLHSKQQALVEQQAKEIAELKRANAEIVKSAEQQLSSLENTHKALDAERAKQLEQSNIECKAALDSAEALRISLAKAELKAEGAEGLVAEIKASNTDLQKQAETLRINVSTLTSQLATVSQEKLNTAQNLERVGDELQEARESLRELQRANKQGSRLQVLANRR